MASNQLWKFLSAVRVELLSRKSLIKAEKTFHVKSSTLIIIKNERRSLHGEEEARTPERSSPKSFTSGPKLDCCLLLR